jgi:hypothetical protein
MSTALYLGIGGGVLLLIIIIVAVMMRGKKDEKEEKKTETSPTTGGSTSPTTGGSTSPTTGGSTSPTTGGSTSPTTGGSITEETIITPDINLSLAKARFCDEFDYGNPCVELGPGDYDVNKMGIPKNKISSIKVPKGLEATLFWNENFKGDTVTIRSDVPNLRYFTKGNDNWNNEVASIKVGLASNTGRNVLLCDEFDYGNPCVELGPGDYDVNKMGIPKNKVSSIKVPNGLEATLFWDENFKGHNVVIKSDVPNLRSITQGSDNWNNELASIKIKQV